MSANEAKWKATQEKVAFLKQFPGLLHSWEEMAGRTVTSVTAVDHSDATVLMLDNGTFAVVPPLAPKPQQLRDGIGAVRTQLNPLYPDAWTRYDILVQRDQDATRMARLENILGAIQNNLDQIPALKDRIRSLVKQWNT